MTRSTRGRGRRSTGTSSGKFTSVVDRRYPLDQIVEAYTYVETGQKIGNVVINVQR